MKKRLLGLALASLLTASAASAEVVIRHRQGDTPDYRAAWERLRNDPDFPGKTITGSIDKLETPTTFYILPFIKIDPNSADGDFTLLAARNEDNDITTVNLEIFPEDSLDSVNFTSNALLSKEVWPINLRTEAADLPVGFDGFQRGWARITSSSGEFSADYFQLDPANDFAAGSRPVDINAGEFCGNVSTRFLSGGGFSGGTKLFFMQDLPLGGDPDTDPPSVTITLFEEDSNLITVVDVFTDSFSFELDAADLTLPGVNFGSMDIRFGNIDDGFSGGYVHTEFKANNRFSVSVKGVCIDTPPV